MFRREQREEASSKKSSKRCQKQLNSIFKSWTLRLLWATRIVKISISLIQKNGLLKCFEYITITPTVVLLLVLYIYYLFLVKNKIWRKKNKLETYNHIKKLSVNNCCLKKALWRLDSQQKNISISGGLWVDLMREGKAGPISITDSGVTAYLASIKYITTNICPWPPNIFIWLHSYYWC